MSAYEALYAAALPARRSGPLYGAFPYATKISPETIVNIRSTRWEEDSEERKVGGGSRA